MSIGSILGTAQNGMQTGVDGVKKNAAGIASKDALQSPDGGTAPVKGVPVTELVEMKINTYQFQASGKVVQAVDAMLGSLLDEKA